MALDRYLAVVYPVDSLTLRSPKNTIIALVVVYTIIVATQVSSFNGTATEANLYIITREELQRTSEWRRRTIWEEFMLLN